MPALFVPVFLLRREYRRVGYHVLFLAGIAWVTTLRGGIGYYVDFLGNLGGWHPAALRSCSVYSFLERTRRLFGMALPVGALSNIVRVALALWVYALSYLSIRREVFAEPSDARLAGAALGGESRGAGAQGARMGWRSGASGPRGCRLGDGGSPGYLPGGVSER